MAKPAPSVLEAEATGLELGTAEREILAAEAATFAATRTDPAARARYAELAAAVESGTVPPELAGALETLLDLLLSTGRARREHGGPAEAALQRLFLRTPRGAALKAAAAEVNEALTALRGQALENLTFAPTARGHSLVITTGAYQLTLAIDRAGVRVEQVETGG